MLANVRISLPLPRLQALLQMARRGALSLAEQLLVEEVEQELAQAMAPGRAQGGKDAADLG